jgi:hypothetical protein
MIALQIRDVDERVRDALAAAAKKRGQTLQSFLHDVINDEARRFRNVAVIERISTKKHGTSVSAEDIVESLRIERQARDAALGVPDAECR